ncbi:hypothetical protein [Nocardia wallacei]|uniref:hypothetical protein n=1 Tax=Nocardia wallacei TaxID=480035 RepID=UPI0024557733|nr:hypothetical protein [Nocardia wallacei]
MDSVQREQRRPTAVCLVRAGLSGLDGALQATLVQRHAMRLGYACLYTVRPPADHPDPVEYGLGIAAGLGVDAVVVYDLATVDNQPSRVCDMFDLETVSPPETWTAAVPKSAADTGPDVDTLLAVLEGLADADADHRMLAARLSPGIDEVGRACPAAAMQRSESWTASG